MKTLYNYIVEKMNSAELGSIALFDIDEQSAENLKEFAKAYDACLEDYSDDNEQPVFELFPQKWDDNFVKNFEKLANKLNSEAYFANISFMHLTGFKLEAVTAYLHEHNFEHLEAGYDDCYQLFEKITFKNVKDFYEILKNVEENVNEAYGCNKESFKEEWEKMIAKKTPMFTFPNGDYVYINYNEEDNCLDAGSMTNAGVDARYSLEIDYDHDLDYNLDDLYEMIIDENPEYLEEE